MVAIVLQICSPRYQGLSSPRYQGLSSPRYQGLLEVLAVSRLRSNQVILRHSLSEISRTKSQDLRSKIEGKATGNWLLRSLAYLRIQALVSRYYVKRSISGLPSAAG